MAAKVRLDEAKCKAWANCVMKAPDIFTITEKDTVVRILVSEVAPARLMQAYAAVRSCPTQALSIE